MKKQNYLIILVASIILMLSSCGKQSAYKYETVPNDPLKAQIYTLSNGLKVYMSVNKEEPRVQTYIAVRVGGKNDPKETTGLAHYLEHIMFKGTKQFGTQNYEAEKELLDEIESLFESYRLLTDEKERVEMYKKIDSISYEASKIGIANEYDKLMAAIGAQGTNAYTSYDETVYVENIPSNQIENWARIQADRFKNNVIRGFHTELEAVYEEKNISLTNDGRKVYETVLQSLCSKHPYGQQTVLGTQEHLKNPSITNIKNYYKTYYVPNNMAICVAGDFDPDTMVEIIEKYFGDMEPNEELPEFTFEKEPEVLAPIEKTVLGLEAENLCLAWRFPGVTEKESAILSMASSVLYNGKAGLIDLDILQKQQVLSAYAYPMTMTDHSILFVAGEPKQGQSLEEVKTILMAEVDKLKQGDFDETLLKATINNFKVREIKKLESNASRANMFVKSFISGTPWQQEVERIHFLSKVTKQDIVEFVSKYMKENYVSIYKRQGQDPNVQSIAKPQITPVLTNREIASPFLQEIQDAEVKPIEPVFVDYEKDMTIFPFRPEIPILYKQNKDNELFSLVYLFEMGSNHNKALQTAFEYLEYLGTSKMSKEELNRRFYELACSFSVSAGQERTYVTLTGLNENLPQALEIFEDLLADLQADAQIYNNMVEDILKEREDEKLNQQACYSKLVNYAVWGKQSPATNVLSAQELKNMNPETLTDLVKKQLSYEHRILYYGPYGQAELKKVLEKNHRVPEAILPIPTELFQFEQQSTPVNKVLFANYEANNTYMSLISNRGEHFDQKIEPLRRLYNTYFGGGMSSIVFQEMRESRALAYSAGASLQRPATLKRNYLMSSYIITQNDKLMNAMEVFDEILNNMPESPKAFDLAKESLINSLRTERVTKSSILWSYIAAQDFGMKEDARKEIFAQMQTLTLDEVKAFQEKWVKNRTYIYCVLGNEKEVSFKELSKYGKIEKVTTEDIFGY